MSFANPFRQLWLSQLKRKKQKTTKHIDYVWLDLRFSPAWFWCCFGLKTSRPWQRLVSIYGSISRVLIGRLCIKRIYSIHDVRDQACKIYIGARWILQEVNWGSSIYIRWYIYINRLFFSNQWCHEPAFLVNWCSAWLPAFMHAVLRLCGIMGREGPRQQDDPQIWSKHGIIGHRLLQGWPWTPWPIQPFWHSYRSRLSVTGTFTSKGLKYVCM